LFYGTLVYLEKKVRTVKKPKYCYNGQWLESSSGKWVDVYDPSRGEIIAQAPCCTGSELKAAQAAFKTWSKTPVIRRTRVLFKFRDLIIQHMDELIHMVARENSKVWSEAEGDTCGAATLMQGESLMNTRYRIHQAMDWQFSTDDARTKLKRLYPNI
jgi:malonate-semialdehyde dehydrogenase (acetylating)/methylmalonate-semialdehyde dehydrogenase